MIKYIGSTFIPNIPTYLVFLVGIYLVISRRKKHPQVSICFMIAIGISLLILLINQIFTATAQYYVTEKIEGISFPMGLFNSIPYLNTILWIFLLFSVFGWRPSQNSAEEKDVINS
jgi:hypothetical protein